jgi:hypothetical protein
MHWVAHWQDLVGHDTSAAATRVTSRCSRRLAVQTDCRHRGLMGWWQLVQSRRSSSGSEVSSGEDLGM